MKRLNYKNKTGAMEMSVGTIVTIVLLMTVLILGLVLVRTIFSGATENIGSIDTAVKNEINKLFSEDNTKKIIIYPPTQEISIDKGEEGGFGFSIRNNNQEEGSFSYTVKFVEKDPNCQMTDAQASSLIVLGSKGTNIRIPSGSALDNPILVKFSIPEEASLCNIRYGIDVTEGGKAYLPTVTVDLQIK
jgi:hypothetical protein